MASRHRTTIRPTKIASSALALTLVALLAACGAKGSSDDAAKKATTTTVHRTTTTEEATTTTSEPETTTTDDSGIGDPTETFTYDFEDDSNPDGWDTGASQKGAVGIEDGAYYTDVSPNAQFLLSGKGIRDWDSGVVGANLHVQKFGQANPGVGIACMAQLDSTGKNLDAYYDLIITAEGNASIFKFVGSAEPVQILKPTAIEGFQKGKPFTMQAACARADDGVGLSIHYNNVDVGTVLDSNDPLDHGAVRFETLGDPKALSTVYIDEMKWVRYD
jgi:hypothetical protein